MTAANPVVTSVSSTSTTNNNAPTLVDQLGGAEKLVSLMDTFYERVVKDPLLQKFFIHADLIKLKRHSLNVIGTAFAPSSSNNNQDVPLYLSKVHRKMFETEGLTEQHFDVFIQHFCVVLEEEGQPPEIIQEAKSKLLVFRPVFERGAANAKKKQEETKSVTPKKKYKRVVQFWDEEKEAKLEKILSDPKKLAALLAGTIVVASCLVVVIQKKRRV